MNRLKLLREENKLLQSDIAKIVSKTPQAIGLYERGKRDIPNNILSILSDFFNVSTDYLLGKSDIRKQQEIHIEDADIAFYNGIKGLNDTNKEILKNIIEGLNAKQNNDTEDKK